MSVLATMRGKVLRHAAVTLGGVHITLWAVPLPTSVVVEVLRGLVWLLMICLLGGCFLHNCDFFVLKLLAR